MDHIVPSPSQMSPFWTQPHMSWLVFPMVFAASVLINKYTLSVLGFTYPTIFQGWQVIVGAASLKVCDFMRNGLLFTWKMDKPGFVSLFPYFMLFLGAIVTGSMALVTIPVSCFLAISNLVPAVVFLFDFMPRFHGSSFFPILSSILVLLTSLMIPLTDSPSSGMTWASFSENNRDYFILFAHVLCLTCMQLYSRIVDSRFSPIDRLFYCYIVAAVFLAPASVYLEEALTALKFENLVTLEFIACCLASGFLGVFLQWLTLANEVLPYYLLQTWFAKILGAGLSFWITSRRSISLFTGCLVVANLLAGACLQAKKIPSPEQIGDPPRV